MKTLSATSENQAIESIQEIHPNFYVHSFGGNIDSIDICVYESEEDFDLDAEECSNGRIVERYTANCLND